MREDKKRIKFNNFDRELKEREDKYFEAIKKVFKKGNFILGDEVVNFEKEFSDYLGMKYCIGVASGLDALRISLMVAGIGEDDEVLTSPISAAATVMAIMSVGANPVFVDIDNNGLMDVNEIESSISKRTKVILPVYLYGNPLDIEGLKKLITEKKIFLIEDACQAHGSTYKGKKLGSIGDFGCFSFYPTKNLSAFGDGGAIVTNNKEYYIRSRRIRDYGQESKYEHVRFGLNSRLDELHAAILRIKLKYLDKDNAKRRAIANAYIKRLAAIPGIMLVLPRNIKESNFHLFVIRSKERDKLKEYLHFKGIDSLIHYPKTIPQQTFMVDGNIKKLTKAERFVDEILSLPCNPWLTDSEIDTVCSTIEKFFTT